MNKIKVFFIVFLLTFLGACSSSVSEEKIVEPLQLSLIEGSGGTAYAVLANAIAGAIENEFPGSVTQIELGSPKGNPVRLEQAEADLAITNSNTAVYYNEGLFDYEKLENLNFVAGFNSSVIHLALRSDLGITTFEEFIHNYQNMKIRYSDGATQVFLQQALLAYDMTEEDLVNQGVELLNIDQGEIAEMLNDGSLDGYILSTSVPGALISQTFASGDMTLLSFDIEKLETYAAKAGYSPKIISSDTYSFISTDISAFETYTVLLSHSHADQDLIYNIVTAIIEHFDYMKQVLPSIESNNLEDLLKGQLIPFSEGAKRAYMDAGVLSE